MKFIQPCIFIVLFVIAIIGAFVLRTLQNKKLSNNINSDVSLSTLLSNANEITIEKKIFSFKPHHYILADNILVGEVVSNVFSMFGDTLTITDVDGNIIKSEYERKRVGFSEKHGFNISLNRLAELVDASGNTTGYIGEERLKNLLSLNHIQYFYDANKNTQGYAKRDYITFYTKDYTVYNSDNTKAYTIDGNLFSLPHKATIKKHNKSNITMEDVIFYTIIENSIIDHGSNKNKYIRKN